MEGAEPRSTSIRPARIGYDWMLTLWLHGFGYIYRSGWRPTRAGAERTAKRRYDQARRAFERRNGWQRL